MRNVFGRNGEKIIDFMNKIRKTGDVFIESLHRRPSESLGPYLHQIGIFRGL